MTFWFVFFLVVHILAAIAAFGPSFAFGLIIGMARKEPQHFTFVVAYIEAVSAKVTVPLTVVIAATGTGLIFSAPGGAIDIWKSQWLLIAVGLYIVAFAFSMSVQLPTERKLLSMLKAMPPGPPPPGGPPPEVAALGKRLQMGGMFLTLLVVTILVLMVWQPGLCQGAC